MELESIITGFIGVIAGGIITFLVTKYSLNQQFLNQKRIIDIEENKKKTIALKSVKREIEHNLIQLEGTLNIMKSEKIEFINYRKSGQDNNLKRNKWEKHSDAIESIDDFDDTGNLQAFYINISFEISNQITDKERTKKAINQGIEVIRRIDKYLIKEG